MMSNYRGLRRKVSRYFKKHGFLNQDRVKVLKRKYVVEMMGCTQRHLELLQEHGLIPACTALGGMGSAKVYTEKQAYLVCLLIHKRASYNVQEHAMPRVREDLKRIVNKVFREWETKDEKKWW